MRRWFAVSFIFFLCAFATAGYAQEITHSKVENIEFIVVITVHSYLPQHSGNNIPSELTVYHSVMADTSYWRTDKFFSSKTFDLNKIESYRLLLRKNGKYPSANYKLLFECNGCVAVSTQSNPRGRKANSMDIFLKLDEADKPPFIEG